MKQKITENTEMVVRRGDANRVEKQLTMSLHANEKASETCYLVLDNKLEKLYLEFIDLKLVI